MIDNRRRTPRLPGEAEVTWHRRGKPLTVRLVNLNAHGMFLRTDEVIPLNQMMDVRVHLPAASLSFFTVSRFVGATRFGDGVGCAIYLLSQNESKQWLAYYQECGARHVSHPPRGLTMLAAH